MSLSFITRGRLIPALAVVILALAPMGEATSDATDRFRLFSGCKPMYLLVEHLPFDAAEIGLTRGAIQAVVESRLRSARLYNPEPSAPYLYVNVNLLDLAFSVRVEYKKLLFDSESGFRNAATTWEISIIGKHGRQSSYILSEVSRLFDKFLAEFLRVNRGAC